MIHSCIQETDQLIVAALQYLYWASFKQASSESIPRCFQQQQILFFIYTIIFVESSMGHPGWRTPVPKKSCISLYMGHLKLPWTLEKRQLRIPGLCRVHSHAWSSVWEEGCSSQPERYPGDCLSMNRLLYGECRGQSNLEGMWASTSFFFFFLSLSQTKSASPTVFFQEAMQHQVPALQKQEQEGVEPLLSQECHPSWHAVPTQGCRATPIPHKQAAPRWMLSRQTLCPEYNQHHKRNRFKAYFKLSDRL